MKITIFSPGPIPDNPQNSVLFCHISKKSDISFRHFVLFFPTTIFAGMDLLTWDKRAGKARANIPSLHAVSFTFLAPILNKTFKVHIYITQSNQSKLRPFPSNPTNWRNKAILKNQRGTPTKPPEIRSSFSSLTLVPALDNWIFNWILGIRVGGGTGRRKLEEQFGIGTMSAAVCGSKRSFFEDIPPSPPVSKRLRCSSSPIRFSAPSLVDQLQAVFPQMEVQVFFLGFWVCLFGLISRNWFVSGKTAENISKADKLIFHFKFLDSSILNNCRVFLYIFVILAMKYGIRPITTITRMIIVIARIPIVLNCLEFVSSLFYCWLRYGVLFPLFS